MRKCITCVAALMILSTSAFGQNWWDRTDWTELSTTTAGNFDALYAADDGAGGNWLYLRLDLVVEANPFDDSIAWHIDANDGTGFDMFGLGTFSSDAMLMSADPWASAVEQTDGVWEGGQLLDGDGGNAYRLLMDQNWYQPFNQSTSTLYYRIDRSQMYHATIGDYLFASDGDPQTIQVGARRGTDDAFIYGTYTIPEPGTMSLFAIGLLGVIGLRRRLK